MKFTSSVETSAILIVDDEDDLRQLFVIALDCDDYKTTEASDGRAALKYLEEQQFDLVLLDLDMPDLSGLDVLAEMRRRGDDTEVAVVSAFMPEFAKERAKALGVTTFLQKPFTLARYREMVEGVLECVLRKEE